MKKIFLLFFLFPFMPLNAQDYQNICSSGITFFKDEDGNLMAFRRDSVIPLGGNDTFFISYRTIRFNDPCFDTTNGSILGREVIKTALGWCWFFNYANDTIKIYSRASLNDTWKFCNLPGNAYIEAKITNIIADSVLGTTDSVKVISFQAKDSVNNNIFHRLNQKFIKLSKHYGLSKMLDVLRVPSYDTNFYQLAGKSNPGLGFQNLQWQEVFNYDIGDEFHYNYSDPYGFPKKFIKKILNKTWYGNNTVRYIEEICGLSSTDYGNTWTYYHNTTNETISDGYSWLTKLPDEFIRNGYTADGYSSMIAPITNRRIQEYSSPSYIFHNHCWVDNNPHLFSSYHTLILEEGLGCTADVVIMAIGSGLREQGTTLVYYKKGSETWGTPIAADCASLSGTAELPDPGSAPIIIQPNPADAQTLVTFMKKLPGETLLYLLYTINGNKVTGGRTKTGSFVLMRNDLPSGVYILVISDTEGNVKDRSRVLFK